jgi:hypothetical protein
MRVKFVVKRVPSRLRTRAQKLQCPERIGRSTKTFFAAHVLYSQCHANCDQSSVMARNDSANEIAVLIMFDPDLLCLFKFRGSRSTLAYRHDSIITLPKLLGIPLWKM